MGVTGGKEMTMSGLDGDFSSAQRKGGGENTPSRAHQVPDTWGAPGQGLV